MQLSPTRFRLPKVLTVALLAGVLGPLLVAVRVPSAALADGDPASDVLLGSNVFYPFDPPVSPSAQRTLNAVTAAAQKARVKVKVALIAAPTDLGVIPSLFGKPQEYADFLYREITFLGPQRLLVVMSDGYGTQGLTPAAQKAVAALPNPAGKTSTDLAQAGVVAVARIAAAEGHPIQAGSGVPSVGSQNSGGGSTTPILIGLVAAAVVITGGVLALRRRQPVASRAGTAGASWDVATGDDGPDQPHRMADTAPRQDPGGWPEMSATTVNRPWLVVQLGLIAAALAAVIVFTVITPAPPPPHFTPATLGDQPPGAVVLAEEDGGLAVGLAAAPRRGQLLMVATVFGQSGGGAAKLHTRIVITTHGGQRMTAEATACTAGCYEAVFDTAAIPERASVTFNGGGRVDFSFPAHGPSASALEQVRDAEAEYRRLRSLVTHERLASDPTEVVYTTYYAVAPHKLRFDVRGGDDTVIIGNRRWDRAPGRRWQASPQEPITPIVAYWTPLVQDATILGAAIVQGQACWVIAFADPQTPGFFTIYVDKSTHRTLELEMTAAAHFMHHIYGPFNAPLKIQPPEPPASRP
ncbi:MAG: hypothetical protein ACLPTJ_14295 [Solirubrobacteraceae bacterium]